MKSIYRQVRYHPIVERAQYLLRRDPTLTVPSAKLELKVAPGDVIIDCGANVGDITSRFARTGAAVYAFEPNRLCFSILAKRFSMMPTVRCFNQGVMNRRTKLTLSTPMPHGDWDAIESTVAASFVPEAINLESGKIEKEVIECIDLNEFIRSLNSRVKLLKMDIEGSEIPVLNHLLDFGSIELIELTIVETHERQIPSLLQPTAELRERINRQGLGAKIRLDWY